MTAAQGEGAAPDVLRLYSHFGAFNLKTEDVIAFPSGLPGFEADRRFVLLSAASFEPVQCLQSIDGPSPSFLVVDPRRVLPDYRARLNQSDLTRLGATDETSLVWLAIVTIVGRGPVRQPQGPGRHQSGTDAGLPAGALRQRLSAAAAAVRGIGAPVLVFTRKRNDAIIIGDGIEIRVLRVGRDSIRLGVKAPPSVPVHRLEIYEQIVEANRAAAARRDLPAAVAARLGKKSEPAK